jgi:hypothetical protein
MFESRPSQLFDFHADLIWPDGPFKYQLTKVFSYCHFSRKQKSYKPIRVLRMLAQKKVIKALLVRKYVYCHFKKIYCVRKEI